MTGCRRRVVCLTDAVDTVLSVPEDPLGAQPCTRHQGAETQVGPWRSPGHSELHRGTVRGGRELWKGSEPGCEGGRHSLGHRGWRASDVRCLGEGAERVQQAPGSREN